ncbi:uncharacterized protein LOC143233128 isoform X1 [Tachypleus tridentatus]|uniref:uncharacterized protein LOC143233128 isoform X1 n=1 Tax=Tachypleus tridentatus TaxID=6853 RepID=UPI003FD1F55B
MAENREMDGERTTQENVDLNKNECLGDQKGRDPKNVQDLAHCIQTLLEGMQDKFQVMSDQILTRIDEMGHRIDDLEKNISDLMMQTGEGDVGGSGS